MIARAKHYWTAAILVALAFAIRIALVPWTGVSAPFTVFFIAVLISGFLWGLRPSLLAAILSVLIATILFVYQTNATPPQAFTEIVLFSLESAAVCAIAVRFGNLKRRAEYEMQGAKKALDERRIFVAVIENSSDFIGIADPNGKPIYVNPAGRRMIGMAQDFPVERTEIPEYYPPENRSFAKDVILKSMVENGYWKGETYFRHWKTENAIPVSDTHFMIRDSGSGRTIGMGTITRDISDLKRVEDELKEAQRVGHIGNWLRDSKGNLIYSSEELYRIYNRNPKLPLPSLKELSNYFTQESYLKYTNALNRLMTDGIPFELELELFESKKWIISRAEAVRDLSGRIIGTRGITQDITELKKLQNLREEWTSIIAHDLRQPITVIKMSADYLIKAHVCETTENANAACARIQSSAYRLARMVDDLLEFSQLETHRVSIHPHWVDPNVIVRESLKRLGISVDDFRIKVTEIGEPLPIFVDLMRIEQVLANLLSNAVKYGEKGSEILIQLDHTGAQTCITVTNHGPGISPDELPRLFSRFSRSKSARTSQQPGLGLGLYISKGLVEAHGGQIWADSIPGKTTSFHFTVPNRPMIATQEKKPA